MRLWPGGYRPNPPRLLGVVTGKKNCGPHETIELWKRGACRDDRGASDGGRPGREGTGLQGSGSGRGQQLDGVLRRFRRRRAPDGERLDDHRDVRSLQRNADSVFTTDPSASFSSDLFRVSGYVGYNWQVAPVWVVGLEADYGWGNNKSTLASRIPGLGVLNGGSFTEVKGKWDASLRARAGLLVTPTLLAYATGGLAYQRIEAIATCPADTTVCDPAVGTQSFSNSSNRVGWTVGGGLEAMFAQNWLARVEYRYSDFDTFSFTAIPFSVSTFGANADLSTKTHIVTGGLAYKFDWGAPVVAKY